MKAIPILSLLLVQSLGVVAGWAGSFDCGSTGAYGAMDITSSTSLQLPPDGIFNCTTITVAQGATLTFSNNSLNTPVYLLATGDVNINGTIDVSGQNGVGNISGLGGPGGFAGGYSGSMMAGQSAGGDGLGPGGGKANVTSGVYGSALIFSGYQSIYNNTNTYGNSLLIPLVGGSGGGGSDGTSGPGSGGGGGAVLIASNTKITVNGAVNSYGGGAAVVTAPSGSGGAIRLLAPIVTGSGNIATHGGSWVPFGNYTTSLAYGRIRIDCTDNQAYLTLHLITPATRGSRMVVFPTNAPALDVIAVGGQPITQGTNSAVIIELAIGASTNQTVLVQGRNFTNDVPISVVVTPQHGPSASFDAVILQSSGNPPSANVPVIIPTGSVCQIHVWTR